MRVSRSLVRPSRVRLPLVLLTLLVACGGGGGDDGAPPFDPVPIGPPAPTGPLVSGPTPVAATCSAGTGTLYVNAEVEPFVAVDPGNPNRLLAAWQQDRWSNGGARAMVSAFSEDGGTTWTRTLHPFSRCGGAAPGGPDDYERATDPWVDFGPGGTAYAMALAFNGAVLAPGSASAMLASRSTDGGRTWSAPATLIRDGSTAFNDKNSLTADPTDPRYVYAVWARFESDSRAPAWLARSADGGLTWEPARALFAPAGNVVVTGNRIVVLSGGAERSVLVNVFNQIEGGGARIGVVRSTDKGLTWSPPVYVATFQGVGTVDAPSGTRIRDGSILPTAAAGPDGSLWLAWQDSRFSGGVRDAIALARSGDGGRTWSAPVAVNRDPAVAAFTPNLHVRADGVIGLLHWDLRSNTPDPNTLPADAWLITSRDGVAWSETRVAGPVDLNPAARSGASPGSPFLGDYHGLTSSGGRFVAVLAAPTGDPANRSDVFAPAPAIAGDGRAAPATHHARAASAEAAAASTEAARRAQRAAIDFALEQRLPGRAARLARPDRPATPACAMIWLIQPTRSRAWKRSASSKPRRTCRS